VVAELFRLGVTLLLGLMLRRLERYLDRIEALEKDIIRLKEHVGLV
jgi:hypothetical protein